MGGGAQAIEMAQPFRYVLGDGVDVFNGAEVSGVLLDYPLTRGISFRRILRRVSIPQIIKATMLMKQPDDFSMVAQAIRGKSQTDYDIGAVSVQVIEVLRFPRFD